MTDPIKPHKNGKYYCVVDGKFYYFGRVPDLETALRQYYSWKENKCQTYASLGYVVNEFLEAARKPRPDGKKLAEVTWTAYWYTCKNLVDTLGRDQDVDMMTEKHWAHLHKVRAETFGPTSIHTERAKVRRIINWAIEAELLSISKDTFAKAFNKGFPSLHKSVVQKVRNEMPKKSFTREQILWLIDKSTPVISATILLGINCAFGATDCSRLRTEHIREEFGVHWVEMARSKTQMPRRCPLFPETIEAIANAGGLPLCRLKRAKKTDAHGSEYTIAQRVPVTPRYVTRSVKYLMSKTDFDFPQSGHYNLRRMVETVGRQAPGVPDVRGVLDKILGHAARSMGDVYAQYVADDHLMKVVMYLRKWLYTEAEETNTKGLSFSWDD